MLLAWTNRADTAALTTDSEVATLPAANVQTPHVAQAWHTVAGVKSARLTFDLGASLACGVLAALGCNFTTAATVRIRASDADPTVTASLLYDSGVVSAGIKTGLTGLYKSFNAVTARYWRIDFADAGVPDNLQVGRVFLGPKWTISTGSGERGGQTYDWSISVLDKSPLEENRGGQTFTDPLPKARLLRFTLDWMDEAEMYGNAFRLAWEAGLTGDVLAIPDIAGSYLPEQAVFGLLTASEPLVHRNARIYRQNFSIKERL